MKPNLGGFELVLHHSYANLANGLITARAKMENKMLVTFRRDHCLISYKVAYDFTKAATSAKKDIKTGSFYRRDIKMWKALCKSINDDQQLATNLQSMNLS